MRDLYSVKTNDYPHLVGMMGTWAENCKLVLVEYFLSRCNSKVGVTGVTMSYDNIFKIEMFRILFLFFMIFSSDLVIVFPCPL